MNFHLFRQSSASHPLSRGLRCKGCGRELHAHGSTAAQDSGPIPSYPPAPPAWSGSGGNWPPVNCLQISWNETVKKPFPLPEKAMKCTDTTFLLLCTLFPSPEIMEQFFGRSPDSWFIRRSAFSAFRPMAYAPLSPNTVKAAVRDSHPLPFSSAGRTPRSPKTLYGISVISVFFGYSGHSGRRSKTAKAVRCAAVI